ncbi:hypothetical protein CALCODRAFT_498235 [Calocera cornea HHB12733]|uniref:histone acetyltransferase n=1 Tax=Calocera cornea HHB12733 TaxID=1353952 RepID=A0A165EY23_9BASI|nr:hypothetical protein CALCODRAFT_498235 [Calocera cornea HHB12733]
MPLPAPLRALQPLPLRTHILDGLSLLPGSRELHLVVLVTPPRRHAALFPYARPRVRGWVQDVLLLVFERGQQQQHKACTVALSATLYLLPTTASAILYISKLDTSGLSPSSLPSPAPLLAHALLTHLALPAHRPAPTLWIHIFARAQGQYLFPNSSENGVKRVLGDQRLCAWWKHILDRVVAAVLPHPTALPLEANGAALNGHAPPQPSTSATQEETAAVHTPAAADEYGAFYLLPGYSALEAARLLSRTSRPLPSDPAPAPAPPPIHWTYGHPYSPSRLSARVPPPAGLGYAQGIAGLIPSFEDDPKTRFVQELASDVDPLAAVPRKRPTGTGSLKSGPASPRKRQRTEEGDAPPSRGSSQRADSDQNVPDGKDSKEPKSKAVHEPGAEEKALARTGVDEFWELVPHRQECSTGAVTAFFVLVFPPPPDTGAAAPVLSEPGARSTGPSGPLEPDSHAAKPLNSTHPQPQPQAQQQQQKPDDPTAPAPLAGQVSPAVLGRVCTALLDLDFGSVERGYRASAVLDELVRVLCASVGGGGGPATGATAGTGVVQGDEGAERVLGEGEGEGAGGGVVPDRGEAEAEDMYSKYISASITLHNPLPPRRATEPPVQPPVVNVLQVKKKRRPAPGTG